MSEPSSIPGMPVTVVPSDFFDDVLSAPGEPSVPNPALSAAARRAAGVVESAEYAAAFQEWQTSGEAAVWESVSADGVEPEQTRDSPLP